MGGATGDTRKRGRPPRATHASDEFIQGRCTNEEKALWNKAASARHITLGEAIRVALTDWAREVLELSEAEIELALAAAGSRPAPAALELEPLELEKPASEPASN